MRQVTYEDTEHYHVTRDFLNNYPRRLQQLLGADEGGVVRALGGLSGMKPMADSLVGRFNAALLTSNPALSPIFTL